MPSASLHRHTWDMAHRAIMADCPGTAPQSRSSCRVQFCGLHPLTRRCAVGGGFLSQLCFPGHEHRAYHGKLKIQREWGLCVHTPEIHCDYIDFWRSTEDSVCLKATLLVIHWGGRHLSWCRHLSFHSYNLLIGIMVWKRNHSWDLRGGDEFMSCALTKRTVSRFQIESLSQLVPKHIFVYVAYFILRRMFISF
jgi:hypothetical protein